MFKKLVRISILCMTSTSMVFPVYSLVLTIQRVVKYIKHISTALGKFTVRQIAVAISF